MSTEQGYLDEKAAGEHIEETHNLDSIEDTTPGAFVWLCAAATAIGGLLFGYDTGVISGVLVVLGSDLDGRPLSASDKELITSLCAAGGFAGPSWPAARQINSGGSRLFGLRLSYSWLRCRWAGF